MKIKDRISKFRHWLKKKFENSLILNGTILLILSLFIFSISYNFFNNDPKQFLVQVLFSSYGMLFDIAIIGMLMTWLTERREKRHLIQSYLNEIDDFRSWVSEEAMFRTVGNIKRLNKNHITEMNLVDCTLRNINLNYADLTLSNLNSADISSSSLINVKMNNCRLNQSNFENSNLNHAEFKGAYATGTNFKHCYLIKSDFEKAYLIKTDFENAFLIEANLRDTIVSDANFNNASLYKADLRGAKGLKAEQLVNAKSLYLTKLDPDVIDKLKELVPHLINV
jgi:uncharacterized protein YjbI with pentapeptide repeats